MFGTAQMTQVIDLLTEMCGQLDTLIRLSQIIVEQNRGDVEIEFIPEDEDGDMTEAMAA